MVEGRLHQACHDRQNRRAWAHDHCHRRKSRLLSRAPEHPYARQSGSAIHTNQFRVQRLHTSKFLFYQVLYPVNELLHVCLLLFGIPHEVSIRAPLRSAVGDYYPYYSMLWR